VYSKVGGHAYGAVYGGPIGAVLTPLLANMQADEGRKLPFLSSLCGACTDACPVGIPLHDLLVRDRALANRAGLASRGERAAWGAWSRAWASPRLYRASARAGAHSGPFARAFGPGASWLDGRATLPLPSTKPFHRRWGELEGQG
jgi:L-lactate dehydrogenase complex protein LldF